MVTEATVVVTAMTAAVTRTVVVLVAEVCLRENLCVKRYVNKPVLTSPQHCYSAVEFFTDSVTELYMLSQYVRKSAYIYPYFAWCKILYFIIIYHINF